MGKVFEIVPYKGATPLHFGSSQNEVEGLLGPADSFFRTDYPPTLGLDPVYESNYYSLNINLAFNLDRRLTYICFSQDQTPFNGKLIYGDIDVFADEDAFERLLREDSEPFEWVGFIMLMNIGIKLEGFHEPSESGLIISLFENGRYDRKVARFKRYPFPKR